jgi:hypothetical protein
VHCVARNFLASREFADVVNANQRVRVWCRDTAGQRLHGTTKEAPLQRFDAQERAALLPLPPTPYALTSGSRRSSIAIAKGCSRAHSTRRRIASSGANSGSVRPRRSSRATTSSACIRVRPRREPARPCSIISRRPSRSATDDARALSAAIGGHRARDRHAHSSRARDRPLDCLQTARGILRLAHKYAPRRLDAACARALAFDDLGYAIVQRILVRGRNQTAVTHDARTRPEAPPQFVRPQTDFFGATEGDHASSHQLTPKLKSLRLSGILETLELRT